MDLARELKNDLLFFLIISFGFSLVLHPGTNVKVIENPKPNMVEKNYIPLHKIRELPEKFPGGIYLLKPFSMAFDKKGNLFAILQRRE